jgi:hypothetical protein
MPPPASSRDPLRRRAILHATVVLSLPTLLCLTPHSAPFRFPAAHLQSLLRHLSSHPRISSNSTLSAPLSESTHRTDDSKPVVPQLDTSVPSIDHDKNVSYVLGAARDQAQRVRVEVSSARGTGTRTRISSKRRSFRPAVASPPSSWPERGGDEKR